MDKYPSIHYTGTEDYFCGPYGFGNDVQIKSYQTYSGLYSGMYAIYGDNRAILQRSAEISAVPLPRR